MPINTNKHNSQQFLKGVYNICIVGTKYNEESSNYSKDLHDSCPIPPVIIFYETIDADVLEHQNTYNTNIKAIYHFISFESKEAFSRDYESLPKSILFSDYAYDEDQVTHLRYRCEDIYNSVTKNDIKKAKMKRINTELIKSKSMEKYFVNHPDEKALIIKSLQESQINTTRPSVSYLPEYLIHDDNKNNVVEQAIKITYSKQQEGSVKAKKKIGKMEKYLASLEVEEKPDNKVEDEN